MWSVVRDGTGREAGRVILNKSGVGGRGNGMVRSMAECRTVGRGRVASDMQRENGRRGRGRTRGMGVRRMIARGEDCGILAFGMGVRPWWVVIEGRGGRRADVGQVD